MDKRRMHLKNRKVGNRIFGIIIYVILGMIVGLLYGRGAVGAVQNGVFQYKSFAVSAGITIGIIFVINFFFTFIIGKQGSTESAPFSMKTRLMGAFAAAVVFTGIIFVLNKPDKPQLEPYLFPFQLYGTIAGAVAGFLYSFIVPLEIESSSKDAGNNRFFELMEQAKWAEDKGKYEEALNLLDEALNLQPGEGTVWFRKGMVLNALEKPEKALNAFDEALDIFPDDTDSLYQKVLTMNKIGLTKNALEICLELVKKQPKNGEGWYYLGYSYLSGGDETNARKSLKRALNLGYEKAGEALGMMGEG